MMRRLSHNYQKLIILNYVFLEIIKFLFETFFIKIIICAVIDAVLVTYPILYTCTFLFHYQLYWLD